MTHAVDLVGFVELSVLPTLAVAIDCFIHLSARAAVMMLALWFYCLHLLLGAL
jgi:hypothetical protein